MLWNLTFFSAPWWISKLFESFQDGMDVKRSYCYCHLHLQWGCSISCLYCQSSLSSQIWFTWEKEKRGKPVCPFLGAASNVNTDLKVDIGTPCYTDETGRAPGGTWHLPFLQVSAPLGLPKSSSWLSASSLFLGSIPRSGKNLRLGWDYLDLENRRLCKERWEGQSGMKPIIGGGGVPMESL